MLKCDYWTFVRHLRASKFLFYRLGFGSNPLILNFLAAGLQVNDCQVSHYNFENNSMSNVSFFTEAAHQVGEIATHINEHIRQHENFQKMLAIQNSFDNSAPKILAPGRQFLKEGQLRKVFILIFSLSLTKLKELMLCPQIRSTLEVISCNWEYWAEWMMKILELYPFLVI